MTENTRVQAIHAEEQGHLTLGEIRALVERCSDIDDEALVYGHDVLSATIMDLPVISVLAVVEKTST